MDIWNWLYESVESHLDKGDESRLELYRLFRRGNDLREDDPEAAFSFLEQGRKQAAALKDGWWVLFLEHWKLQNLLHAQRDYGAARDLAMRCAVEARKPQFAALPQRVCLQEDLISSVVHIDARGHAQLVEDALDYMAREADENAECAMCLRGLRASFELERGDYGAAHAASLEALAFAESKGSEHHAMSSHVTICGALMWTPFPEQELLDPATFSEETKAVRVAEGFVSVESFQNRARLLDSHALRAQELAKKIDYTENTSEILMWRAHAALLLEDFENGEKLFKAALDNFFSSGHFPDESFFVAWRSTYARLGDWEQALRQIDDEEKWIEGKGQIAREARLARTKCHFKWLNGNVEEADFEMARNKIEKLGAPEYERGRLEELENGWRNAT